MLPLGDQNSANVWLYEENHELYAITTEIIPPRKVLMLGYSKKYADDYGLVGPTKDIETGDFVFVLKFIQVPLSIYLYQEIKQSIENISLCTMDDQMSMGKW